MGAWGSGPFDNDGALDFVQSVEAADPDRRADTVRAALMSVVEGGGYLDIDDGSQAVAAAAVVAAGVAGGSFAESVGAPASVRGGGIDLPADLPPLALRALDRVAGDDSEWSDLWNVGQSDSPAAVVLASIRAVLERGVEAVSSDG